MEHLTMKDILFAGAMLTGLTCLGLAIRANWRSSNWKQQTRAKLAVRRSDQPVED